MDKYLSATEFFDSDHPTVLNFAKAVTEGKTTQLQKAVSIYYAVRDRWWYSPKNIGITRDAYKASAHFQYQEGHCLDKATTMVACCRAVGIPARLCLAKVVNHIAAEDLMKKLGTNELVPHGYVEVWLNERWVKATPAFNKKLCDHLNVNPLEFDGKNDSIFQEFDKEGGKFMEYLEEYGDFDELPLDFMLALWEQHYPGFKEWQKKKGERVSVV